MAKRITVALAHDGKQYYVPLPTYVMVPGSFKPVTALLLTADGPLAGTIVANVLALNPTVDVDIPDADYPNGVATDAQLKAHLDARYKENAGKYSPAQK